MKRNYKILNYKEGMEIKKPCIIRNMPSEVYHKHKALSNSGLKTLIDCPAKYYYKYLSGEYKYKETPSFKIGKAAHMYILEGRKAFEGKYWHNPYSEFKKEELIQILKTFGYDDSIKKYLVSDLMELLLDRAGIKPKEIHLTSSELNQVICLSRSIKEDKKTKKPFLKRERLSLAFFGKMRKRGFG